MKEKLIKLLPFAVIAIALVFIGVQLNSTNERVTSLESDYEFDALLEDVSNTAYKQCVGEAWDDYSLAWDKKCWSLGKEADCTLTIADRYQVAHEYQNDVIDCLAERN